MVRRIRFIYRKSYSKFGNDPVHLWKVLEGSRKVRKKSLRKEESRRDSTSPWPANPRGGGVPSGLPQGGPATPSMEGGTPTSSGSPSLGRFPYHMEGFGFGSYSETCSPTLGASTYIMRDKGRGPATSRPPPGRTPKWPANPSQTLAAPSPP